VTTQDPKQWQDIGLVKSGNTDDAKLYLGAIMQDHDLVMGDDDEADDDAMASIMMDAPDRY
jgi:hypothetical protein